MPERKIPKTFDPEKTDDSTLIKLLGDKKTVDEFRRFKDKAKQREIRRDLEIETTRLLESDFREANEVAIEGLNVVYRKAWTKACKNLKFPESEFPSKY